MGQRGSRRSDSLLFSLPRLTERNRHHSHSHALPCCQHDKDKDDAQCAMLVLGCGCLGRGAYFQKPLLHHPSRGPIVQTFAPVLTPTQTYSNPPHNHNHTEGRVEQPLSSYEHVRQLLAPIADRLALFCPKRPRDTRHGRPDE
jgi:hypothetical protein